MKISRIIFMGTPEFAVPVIKKLSVSGYKPVLCITQPDKPQGRRQKIAPSEVKLCAIDEGIPLLQPENVNDQEIYELINEQNPELIITAAYGGYLGRRIRNLPSIASINIHPSLLPRYRGASPVNACLGNGDKETGVSIFRLVARMDAGPLLYQSHYKIQPEDNYTELQKKLSFQGAEDTIELIHQMEDNRKKEIPQNEDAATYCKKLKKEDQIINWENSAVAILNQVRALAEKPGAVTTLRSRSVKIILAKIIKEKLPGKPGEIIKIKNNQGIVVKTGDYGLLIEQIQPAGKKIMTAFDYHLGARLRAGEFFGKADGSK